MSNLEEQIKKLDEKVEKLFEGDNLALGKILLENDKNYSYYRIGNECYKLPTYDTNIKIIDFEQLTIQGGEREV